MLLLLSQRLKTKAQAAEEYSGAQIPHNEDARYGQLCALNVLNTEADPRFDDITNLVRALCCRAASKNPCETRQTWVVDCVPSAEKHQPT